MEYLSSGKITSTIGIKGEVKVFNTSSFANVRYKKNNKIYVYYNDEYLELVIEKSYQKDDKFYVVKFKGINSIEEASKFKNCYLFVIKDNDILMVIVRAAFLLVVSFAYVAVGQSTLVAWSEIIFRDSRAKQLPICKRVVVILVSNLPQLLIAMFLANAKPALSIGGAMGGCMADFFFPAIMWIKNSEYPIRHWQNILCIIFAIFGLVTTVIATYQAVVDAINSFKTTG